MRKNLLISLISIAFATAYATSAQATNKPPVQTTPTVTSTNSNRVDSTNTNLNANHNANSNTNSNTNSSQSNSAAIAGSLSNSVSAVRNNVRIDNDSSARSNSVATGGNSNSRSSATGGQATSQASTGSSQAQTGDQAVTVNNTTVNSQPDDIRIRNTPNASAWAAAPSATCIVTGGAGVAIPGFGGSVSGGQVDEGCTARENARILMSIQPQAALRVLCEADIRVARNVAECADIAERLKQEKTRVTHGITHIQN
jgi:hypothetical protein